MWYTNALDKSPCSLRREKFLGVSPAQLRLGFSKWFFSWFVSQACLVHVNTLQVIQGSLELTFHVDEM